MFRKPREFPASDLESTLQSSIGRPPTPPSQRQNRASDQFQNPLLAKANSPISFLSRSKTTTSKGKTVAGGSHIPKAKGKSNGSILNFFKREDSGANQPVFMRQEEESLFFEDETRKKEQEDPIQTPTPPEDNDRNLPYGDTETSVDGALRYNENVGSVKRRRTDDVLPREIVKSISPEWDDRSQYLRSTHSDVGQAANGLLPTTGASPSGYTPEVLQVSRPEPRVMVEHCSGSVEIAQGPRIGPFIADPDDSDEVVKQLALEVFGNTAFTQNTTAKEQSLVDIVKEEPKDIGAETIRAPPLLKHESTSAVGGDGFDGIEDFIEDEFPEDGEEYMERRWIEEQQRLELGLDEDEDDEGTMTTTKEDGESNKRVQPQPSEESSSCPICSASLVGISSEQASIHVNHCLDDNPIPLPELEVSIKAEPVKHKNPGASHRRFQRAAVAKPGQDNPFTLGSSNVSGLSAFSKLMSSHAEDEAWATAAASETASRGKPAYQRTCPFYKILPGFSICVDAFRYGAVEGCKAYFLSHFHSDHYIGLTSSWCHGPIYCSHVTANLVRRQLHVDPKWVVDLDFDSKVEVPGTQGVDVTMIPANHCPGSSLYLFEKVVGRGKNPKVHRVLHCGDFRACPAHVQHPLLRPDMIDIATGRNAAQQKLDVCYLDTTYLTPKYAFPSQAEVIKACADMCVSLGKERVDESDDWEQTKKERAGSGMVKFVRKDSDMIKEEAVEDDIDAMKVNTQNGRKSRGRLLVIVGTYSIGKERICLGVAKALNSKIYAPPNKQKICAALEDPELMARLTNNPLEAQVHMQMLMEIRAETLADYLTGFKPHFARIVGFRPSGWNYRPPNSRFVESPAVQTVLYSDNWKSRYSMAELVPQRGSTREASCFGVPYSEHSSFRELTMFCCALRIDKIIPTVNVGSAKSREKMKAWCEKWAMEKKKSGLFKVQDGQTTW